MTDTAADLDAADAHSEPTPIGVKLGSNRTVVVYRDEDGQRETAHTLTRLATSASAESDDHTRTGEVAVQQYSDNTGTLLRSGVPRDARRAEQTERFFEELCAEHDLPEDSAVVYAIPSVDDECGLANLNTVVEQSSIGETLIRGYPESLCGAIPALGDRLEAIDQIFVAVNLGATKLEACAYRHGDRHTPFSTSAVTGVDVDEAIVDAVADETDGSVTLDRDTARAYKETHADFDSYEPFSETVERRSGHEHEFTVEHGVMGPLDAYLDDVVEALTTEFFSQLANREMKTYQLALTRPLVVTGGMACIPGLVDELAARLGDELDRDVTAVTSNRPAVAAAEGAYRIATRLTATD
ncbi:MULTISPECIES: hypothetical protein [Haloferax]|uniref:Actin-like ATPase involved in cell morphogenesis n=1 Tax=Haloferax marinum TaxID=2666143 RepID=A0A6A8G4Q7_9EURY|nr:MULTISPECIES: hypothetical protein [Haloferax]KAB1196569.1 hypothetical protein Hfx1150_03165 [Haloferax sp. CBA1150]MRW95572.1 hypothetical protein [Haloferax marinum]